MLGWFKKKLKKKKEIEETPVEQESVEEVAQQGQTGLEYAVEYKPNDRWTRDWLERAEKMLEGTPENSPLAYEFQTSN